MEIRTAYFKIWEFTKFKEISCDHTFCMERILKARLRSNLSPRLQLRSNRFARRDFWPISNSCVRCCGQILDALNVTFFPVLVSFDNSIFIEYRCISVYCIIFMIFYVSLRLDCAENSYFSSTFQLCRYFCSAALDRVYGDTWCREFTIEEECHDITTEQHTTYEDQVINP